jgi:hypothetical protein
MDTNILNRIDSFLRDHEVSSRIKTRFIEKQDAVAVMDCIIKSVPDDKVLLETIKDYINHEWSVTNVQLIERFYKLMNYYGIIEEDSTFRKTILETKGKTVVRTFVNVENKAEIKRILK